MFEDILLGGSIRNCNGGNGDCRVDAIIGALAHKLYKTTISGKPIEIRTGDLFVENGWKVIYFNDHYDTKTDDVCRIVCEF